MGHGEMEQKIKSETISKLKNSQSQIFECCNL